MAIVIDPKTYSDGPQIHVCADGTPVAWRRISPVDLRNWERAWLKANPQPSPPAQKIDGEQVENRGDPDYLAARAEWEEEHGAACVRTLLLLGCVVDVDMAAVAAHRALFAELDPPIDLDPNDRYVYLSSILVRSEVDLQELYQKISGQLAVNEEDVKAAEADFQRSVPGDSAEELAPAEVGD